MTDKFVALAADNEQALNWAEDSSDDQNEENVWNKGNDWDNKVVDIRDIKEGDDDGIPEVEAKQEEQPQRREVYSYRPERKSPAEKLAELDRPPWTAFIGNLLPTTQEAELGDFFGELGVKDIRLVPPKPDKQYTFAYIEFETKAGLANALEANGTSIQEDRRLKVDVADNKQRRYDNSRPRPGGRGRGGYRGGYSDRYDDSWGSSSGPRPQRQPRIRDEPRRPRPSPAPRSEESPRERTEDPFGGA